MKKNNLPPLFFDFFFTINLLLFTFLVTEISCWASNKENYKAEFVSDYTESCTDMIISDIKILRYTPNKIFFSVNIKNNGSTNIDKSIVSLGIYVSNDNRSNGVLKNIALIGEGLMFPGQTSMGTYESDFSFNDSLYYLRIKVDEKNTIEECDETNNVTFLLVNKCTTSGILSLKGNIQTGFYASNQQIDISNATFENNVIIVGKQVNMTAFNISIPNIAIISAGCLVELSASQTAIELAHAEIWRRFVNEYDCINDYTDLDGTKILPTAEECRDGKPNALGWWSPIESAPMFGGLYMDGIIKRWESTHSKQDEEKVRRIAKGLMLMASVSNVEGFVARGVASDGRSHYPMGSNDQTGGWFYGLWRYLETGIPSLEERKQIEDKLVRTAKAILKLKWLIPAEPPFNIRGGFNSFNHNCSRLLFVAKSMYLLTKDEYWNQLYVNALKERGGSSNLSRLEVVAKGIEYYSGKTDTWDESPSIGCLRLLWELETDPQIRESYRQGLENSASAAMQSISKAYLHNNADSEPYELDWRRMNWLWRPQTTSAEAEAVARAQLNDLYTRNRKFFRDATYVREPVFAAWVVSLAPDIALLKQRKPELEKIIQSYKYEKLYEVWFFPVIATWYRINNI